LKSKCTRRERHFIASVVALHSRSDLQCIEFQVAWVSTLDTRTKVGFFVTVVFFSQISFIRNRRIVQREYEKDRKQRLHFLKQESNKPIL
jgi:hypothetical protein